MRSGAGEKKDTMSDLWDELTLDSKDVMLMLAKCMRFARRAKEYRMKSRSSVLDPAQDVSEGNR